MFIRAIKPLGKLNKRAPVITVRVTAIMMKYIKALLLVTIAIQYLIFDQACKFNVT